MKNLLEISKKHMALMMERTTEVTKDDFIEFNNYLEKYSEIDNMEVKPYLVIIHENMWEVFHDFEDEVMEYLGYEHIGRMESKEKDENDFIFEYEDMDYDTLYRLISPDADYTKTVRF